MTIRKSCNEGQLCVSLGGRLDTVTAPELDAELKNSLEGVTDLVLDLADLEYISSSGLRVLLSAQKIMNKQGRMRILHANEMVMEIFDVTGFTKILTFE